MLLPVHLQPCATDALLRRALPTSLQGREYQLHCSHGWLHAFTDDVCALSGEAVCAPEQTYAMVCASVHPG